MDGQTQIPENVAMLIENKKIETILEQADKEHKIAQERAIKVEVGRQALRVAITKALEEAIPEWLRQYDVTESCWGEDSLTRISDGYEKLDRGLRLQFEIPGLAPIQHEYPEGNWRSADAYKRWNEYGPAEIHLDFTRECYWCSDLDYTLIEAEKSMLEYQKMRFDAQQEYELHQHAEERSATIEAENEAKNIAEKETRQTEEQELVNALKDDPVAVHLMKAFLMVRQERGMFEERINEADYSLVSMEERWSRRAEALRRQAEDADRRAEEERSRASDIEDDLQKANKKLKQTERGW